MDIISLVIFIFFLPFGWFLWSSMGSKSGMLEQLRWKKPLLALLALIVISAVFNYHYSNAYQLDFFQNGFELRVGLIVAAAFLAFFYIINILVGIFFKNAPKSIHNPKVVWIGAVAFSTIFLFFLVWVYPLAQKASYINQLETAISVANAQQSTEEITIVFISSEQHCVRTNTSNCNSTKFKNSFFVKNNLDEKKEVQVRIRALDSKKNELKVVESNTMTLQAGELKLLETEESSEQNNIWSRSSFETDYRTHSYESLYRYRNTN